MKKERWEIIARDYGVSLFPIFLLVDGLKNGIKKHVGQGCDVGLILEKRVNTYIYLPSVWQSCHTAFVRKIKNNLALLKEILNKIKVSGDKLVEYSQSVCKKDLSKLKNKEIWQLYSDYCQVGYETYSLGVLLPLLDFHDSTFISDEIKKYLASKLKASDVNNYFSTLTTPIDFSDDKRQELDLFKIFIKCKKSNKVLSLLKTKDNQKILDEWPPRIRKLLEKHTKRYAWIIFVFEGPAADIFYFIDILKDFAKRNVNPQKEIQEILDEQKLLISLQKKYLDKLNPDNYLETLISLAPKFVHIKAQRKFNQFKSYYYIEKLLKEISRRLHLSLAQVRMMLPAEVKKALLEDADYKGVLNERLRLTIYCYLGSRKKILSGRKAEDFINYNVKFGKVKKVKKIIGTTASPGRVKGIVKIVNMIEDIKKFKKGNILVSSATNPNLMPAIRQAAAIVTDEGGLTCHAAIVSREFKIPCVVGTKIATKVLKDGDLVEVDATKGIVRRIK